MLALKGKKRGESNLHGFSWITCFPWIRSWNPVSVLYSTIPPAYVCLLFPSLIRPSVTARQKSGQHSSTTTTKLLLFSIGSTKQQRPWPCPVWEKLYSLPSASVPIHSYSWKQGIVFWWTCESLVNKFHNRHWESLSKMSHWFSVFLWGVHGVCPRKGPAGLREMEENLSWWDLGRDLGGAQEGKVAKD